MLEEAITNSALIVFVASSEHVFLDPGSHTCAKGTPPDQFTAWTTQFLSSSTWKRSTGRIKRPRDNIFTISKHNLKRKKHDQGRKTECFPYYML